MIIMKKSFSTQLFALILGGVLLLDNAALAAVPLTVTDYAALKEAVGNATEPTEITLEGTITDDASGQLYIEGKEITLKGGTLQSADAKHLGLDVQSDGILHLDGTTMQDYDSGNKWGGAVYNEGVMTLKDVTFTNNTTNGTVKGAVATYNSGETTLTGNSSFIGNKSGALFNGAVLTVSTDDTEQMTFTGNTTPGHGGAIYNEDSLNISGNYLFTQNASNSYGGAIANAPDGTALLRGTYTFTGNQAGGQGGAISNRGNMFMSASDTDRMTFSDNGAAFYGGAIFNEGTLSLFGNYDFTDNSLSNAYSLGGALYNTGVMSLEGAYTFTGNRVNTSGGAVANRKGNLTINGTRNSAGEASVVFDGNYTTNTAGESRGGAIYVRGDEDKQAFLNIKNADFKNNYSSSHGGAIYVDEYVDFNIEDSKFIGNKVNGFNGNDLGWGGAIGLDSKSDTVNGYISNTLFDSNYSNDSGGALPSGTALTVVNSTFVNNHARFAGGALSYNPKNALADKFLKVIADGGDTVFSGNWVGNGDAYTPETSEGLYLGVAITDNGGLDGSPVTGADGNDSNVYLNAGNSGRIIFNDMVDALGAAKDDMREKTVTNERPNVNNPNIQLNQAGITYGKLEPSAAKGAEELAPTNGTIIFNNTIKGANLVLHNGVLAFGRNNAYAAQSGTTPAQYFSDGGRITLKGGALDLMNGNLEAGNLLNPDSVAVLGNAKLRLDLNLLGNGADLGGMIDYIASGITGSGTLTLDNLTVTEDASAKNAAVGSSTLLQFAKSNTANTLLDSNLKTIITSSAGYVLSGDISNTDDSTQMDSVKVTKVINAGGLPIAVSLGGEDGRTYVYNATEDEEITGYDTGDNAWGKSYSVLNDDGTVSSRVASNVLKGNSLQINGNGKNVIASPSANVVGIELGTNQTLAVNNVKKDDNTGGWSYFNSAFINHGGTVDLTDSIFSDNHASDVTFTRTADGTAETVNKLGHGGAVYNEAGTVNITNSNFTGNTATGKGGAIYNAQNATVNILADNNQEVTFSGNQAAGADNDVYNEGILNLAAADKSSIIFNGGIAGSSANLGQINIGAADKLGRVVFNNTVANQNVTLNNGTLQLGANATAGRTDYFDNVNLTLNGGVFNLQNGFIDTVAVNNLTVGADTPQFLMDVNLADQKSDAISLSDGGSVTANGALDIGPLNIVQGLADGQTSATVQFINTDELIASLADVNKSITQNGITYSVALLGNNRLSIAEEGKSGGFAYEVIHTDHGVSRTFNIGDEDEVVNNWIDNNNRLAGLSFQINGVSDKGLIANNNIKGIELGLDEEGNAQTLLINKLSTYEGFNSAVINNGGEVNATATKFQENHATAADNNSGNGGVVQNNSGTLKINGNTEFVNNSAENLGGAIYNAAGATVEMNAVATRNISFSGNTAGGSSNDIYNAGSILMNGNGEVTVSGGIAGTQDASIVNNTSAEESNTLNLGGDNSAYLGSFTQNNGVTNVLDNAQFFAGNSNIKGGSLNWNTANDLTDGAALTVNGGDLTVGANGQLTVSGASSIDNAASVTANGNLILAKDMTVKKINGTGTLTAKDANLTFDASSVLADGLNWSSSNAQATLEGLDSADNLLAKIANGTNDNLTLALAGSNANADVTVDGAAISSLQFSDTVNYGGNLLNKAQVSNTGNLTLSGAMSGSGAFTNAGTLAVTGDQSNFAGSFIQTAGQTTVDTSGHLFGGVKDIQAGSLTVSGGTVDYTDVKLGSQTSLNQTVTDGTQAALTGSALAFTGSGAQANFTGGNLRLGKLDNGQANTVSFDGSKVSLADGDYSGGTTYDFKNAELDLTNSTGTTGVYNFTKVNAENTKLSFNVNIVPAGTKEPGERALETDYLAVASGNPLFNLGNIHISGEENGYKGGAYNTTRNVLSGATFSPLTDSITVASTSWIYDLTQTADNQSIQLAVKDYAGSHTLYQMNDTEGTRFFQFSDGDTREYHIDQSLDATKDGVFTVSSQNENKNVLSGALVDADGNLTGENGSFFQIGADKSTQLTIDNVIIQDAAKDGNGSVVSNDSQTALVTIKNAIIKDNTATGNGGALYNGANTTDGSYNMVVSNTQFENNGADGLGGAIYNAGNLLLDNVALAAASGSAKNDIYQSAAGSLTFTGTNTVNSAISGEGTLANKGALTLTGDNSQFTGNFTQGDGAVTTVSGDEAQFFGGTSTIDGGHLLWQTANAQSGTLLVNGGTLTVDDGAKLALGAGSVLAEAAKLQLLQNAELTLQTGSKASLTSADVWGGKLALNGGELNLNNITNYTGAVLAAESGDLNVNGGNLIVAAGSEIKETVNTTVANEARLQVDTDGKVSLGSGTDWQGEVLLNGGDLTVKDLTSTGTLKAASGNLTVAGGTLTVAENSVIADSVTADIQAGATVSIEGGEAAIGDDDTWDGTLQLGANNKGGTLNYSATHSGTLQAETGNLNLLSGSVLDIQNPSQVAQEVLVDLQQGAKVTVRNGAEFNLDDQDKWNGTVSLTDNGKFSTDGVNNTLGGGVLQQENGEASFGGKSDISITNGSYISGGKVSLSDGSALRIGSGVTVRADGFNLAGDSLVSTVNGSLDTNQLGDVSLDGVNHFAIDLSPRTKTGDTFVMNQVTSVSNGTFNVADFNFVGGAPTENNIKFQVFDAQDTGAANFTASNKKIATPVGNYQLSSLGGGAYMASLADFNPQAFRGQVATLAAYNHQIFVEDMVTNHFILGHNLKKDIPEEETCECSCLEGAWMKTYASLDKLRLTQGLNVKDNSYGALAGVDLAAREYESGWNFIPTVYLGYQNAEQTFYGVKNSQDGAFGGVMGTFQKDAYTLSATVYGGGYNNKMKVSGVTDRTDNWFAVAAAKAAYNYQAAPSFVIQPNLFVAYNTFGKQNWDTDYGEMAMSAEALNGFNVAPGVNFTYLGNTWNAYATAQYMFNLNNGVGGTAGNIDLPDTKLRQDYANFGLGVSKSWREHWNGYAQINLRAGSRTKGALQAGVEYAF